MIRILLICFILWLGNKFLCSGTAGDSSSEDFYAAITASSSRDTGHSSTRTLKAKAQSLLVSWLEADSKNNLSDTTFLGEAALMKLFTKYNTPIPSSAAVERLFSIGKEILRARRCQLSDNMFERLMFMKSNLHHMVSKKWNFLYVCTFFHTGNIFSQGIIQFVFLMVPVPYSNHQMSHVC